MNKHMKLTATLLIALAGLILIAPDKSYAFPPPLKQEIRAVKQAVTEDINEKASTRPGLLQRIAGKLGKAAIINGTISAKAGTTLTVTKDGKTYTVQTDSKTQFRRRFWGKGSLDELQVGHLVNVHGKWTDDSQTTIAARLIRDLSIQKRYGVFFGTVTAVSSNGWVMETIRRENQTVTVSTSTRFVNRRGESISQSDIAVGHKVRVRGLWDRQANTVTEVTHVKDFSLPPIPTPSK